MIKMEQVNFNLDYYAPDFSIKIGKDHIRELNGAIISLEVDENLENASMFTLNINEGWNSKEQKFNWLDNKLLSPEKGQDIEIYTRYASRGKKYEEPLITGKITALNPSFPSTGIPTLTVQGYDLSMGLKKAPVDFKSIPENINDFSELVEKIATKHGFDKTKIEKSNLKPLKKVAPPQGIDTDYQFVEWLANFIGYEFFIRNKFLYFRKPGDSKKEDEKNLRVLRWGREIMSFSPRLSTASVVTKVTVTAQDSSNPQNPIEGIATLNDISSGESGAKTGAEFVKASENKSKGENEFKVTDIPISSAQDAKTVAEAILQRKNNSLIEGSCECIGIPELRPGTSVIIKGVGGMFSGKYYIKSVKHSISAGYTMSFEVRRGAIGTGSS